MAGAGASPADSAAPPPPGPVLLVHGLWHSPQWLRPLAWRLRRAGLACERFGWSTIAEGPELALPRLVERLRRSGTQSLVCHSLGGLLALQALAAAPDLPVRRVVCLGSPLRGSTVARAMAGQRRERWMLGRSRDLLQAGVADWRGRAEIGLIAGTRPVGMGRCFAALPDSDGTVAWEDTRLPGLAAACRLPVSHNGLLFSAQVAGWTLHFLGHGRFPEGPESVDAIPSQGDNGAIG